MNKCNLLLVIFLFCFHAVTQAVEFEAKLDWIEHQKYGFYVNGIVDEVSVEVGKKLKQGDALAKLISAPFNYEIKHCRARVDGFDAPVFDAKIELDQAEELFERTVLSEVELQKIEGKYKSLVERQKEAMAECQLRNWQKKVSRLVAHDSVYVISSNITPGMVISDENKSDVGIELVSAKQAAAIAWLNYKQKSQLNLGYELKVIVDQQEFSAKINSISLTPNNENKYKLVANFFYTKMVEPGKVIKVRY